MQFYKVKNLQKIIRYIGVGSANMEEGSFRCDANISIREEGSKELGTKVEIKNMNRVSAVADAVDRIAQAEGLWAHAASVRERERWANEGLQA